MTRKGNIRRILSGVMAAMTLLSATIPSVTILAEEYTQECETNQYEEDIITIPYAETEEIMETEMAIAEEDLTGSASEKESEEAASDTAIEETTEESSTEMTEMDTESIDNETEDLSDEEQEVLGSIHIYNLDKEDEHALPGSVFQITASEDILDIDGEILYEKGAVIEEDLVTGDDGCVTASDLPMGTYLVSETQSAEGYLKQEDAQEVILSVEVETIDFVESDVYFYSTKEAPRKWKDISKMVDISILNMEKGSERMLTGAVYGLYAGENIETEDGDMWMEKDALMEEISADDTGEVTVSVELPVGFSFYISEISPAEGFVSDSDTQDFVLYDEDDDLNLMQFTFENEPTAVELTNVSLKDGECITGSQLSVVDDEGNVVDEWTSKIYSHVITELPVGRTYTLVETRPAEGYVTAESVEFLVEDTAAMQVYEMVSDVTKVSISKKNASGTAYLSGGKITILDENEQVIDRWACEGDSHYVESLPIGNYILREDYAPKGYILTGDIPFSVTDTAEIQYAEMKDETAKGKIILNKMDQETGKPLSGVEFELRDSQGNVLETLKTDAAGHAESSLYEIATYNNGVYEDAIKYYLKETKTQDGYKLDDKAHEITFTYVNDSTPIIEVKMDMTNEDAPVVSGTPGSSVTSVLDVPQTGDTTDILLPALMMLLAGGSMSGVMLKKKFKRI